MGLELWLHRIDFIDRVLDQDIDVSLLPRIGLVLDGLGLAATSSCYVLSLAGKDGSCDGPIWGRRNGLSHLGFWEVVAGALEFELDFVEAAILSQGRIEGPAFVVLSLECFVHLETHLNN